MKKLYLAIIAMLLVAFPAKAQEEVDGDTGHSLPRMVSLRSNLINARSGPGSRYPIEWVYKQKNAPVEIVAEFELWRKIKDWEGSETWVHKAMLVNKRWIKMTKPGTSNIYAKPQSDSRVIAKVEDQVIGKVEKCPEQKDFCLIRFSSIEGWVNRSDFYGIYPGEVIN
jgi:SH3-like domain-containing protein